MTELYHRFADHKFESSSVMPVKYETFVLDRRTDNGVYIKCLNTGKVRFISGNMPVHTVYASPTMAKAREAYKARKHRQIQQFNAHIADAEECLRYIEYYKPKLMRL